MRGMVDRLLWPVTANDPRPPNGCSPNEVDGRLASADGS